MYEDYPKLLRITDQVHKILQIQAKAQKQTMALVACKTILSTYNKKGKISKKQSKFSTNVLKMV